jgi:hypothetical protein
MLELKSDLGFLEFYFEIHFESGELPMDKVVPCLILYNSVFYLKFFDQDKASF